MRRALHSLGAVLLLFLTHPFAAAQFQPGGLFLLRLERTSAQAVSAGSANSECIIVYPDGRYHWEHTFQPFHGPVSATVVEATLPEDGLKELSGILDAPELVSLNPPKPSGQLVFREAEFVSLAIKRGHSMQSFALMDIQSNKSYEKALKPLLAWFKATGKKKIPPKKNADSTRCQPEFRDEGRDKDQDSDN